MTSYDNDFIYLSAVHMYHRHSVSWGVLRKHLEEAIVKTIFVKENAQSKENWRVIIYSETTGLLLTENY